MKKLKLSMKGEEMLSRDQMRKVSGGYPTDCHATVYCKNFYNNEPDGSAVEYSNCADETALNSICNWNFGWASRVSSCTCS